MKRVCVFCGSNRGDRSAYVEALCSLGQSLVGRGVGLVFGGSGGGAGVGSTSSGSTSTSQRTLTVIIKFDDNNMVRDFSYHSSQF